MKELLSKELEQLIYEAATEQLGADYYKKLVAERKRRSLEE